MHEDRWITVSRSGIIPLYGRSLLGHQTLYQAIRNFDKNVTLLANMSLSGMQAALTREGAADEAAFETFVRKVALLTLQA